MGRAFAPNSDSGVARANSREATPYRRRRLAGARPWSRSGPSGCLRGAPITAAAPLSSTSYFEDRSLSLRSR